jgi:dynamin-like GTPase MGM1, mitochondrial
MSGRLLSARLASLARPAPSRAIRQLHHQATSATSGLLRTDTGVRAARRRIWPMGYNSLHNAVAVRNASFVRILPNLVLKFARIPAIFGGAMIAGLAYLQYQATRMFKGSVGRHIIC